jgi:hypothetical protein
MATQQPLTREDIEIAIENCKEEIYAHKHTIRWFRRFVRFFWLGLAVAIIMLAFLVPFNIPVVGKIFEAIATISSIIAVIAGICIIFTFFTDLDR